MKDLRQTKISLRGVTRLAGMQINEETVEEMLTTMGVDPDEQIVREAIGFLSSNSMEFSMENLYQFLKSKSIMSGKKDLRKKK
jgi:ribosomal protein L12E/L44/L45/RPP1/RPP2